MFHRLYFFFCLASAPLVDSSHDGCGAPQRQLGSENDRKEEQVGFLDFREGRRVGLAQRVQLITSHSADLREKHTIEDDLCDSCCQFTAGSECCLPLR